MYSILFQFPYYCIVCHINISQQYVKYNGQQFASGYLDIRSVANSALSGIRMPSMQVCDLFHVVLAGRFKQQEIHTLPSRSPLDPPISDIADACLMVGWTPIQNRWVKRLASAGSVTAAIATIQQTVGSFVSLEFAWAHSCLIGRLNFALDKGCSSFVDSRESPHLNRGGYFLESILALSAWALHSAATHKISSLDARNFACELSTWLSRVFYIVMFLFCDFVSLSFL